MKKRVLAVLFAVMMIASALLGTAVLASDYPYYARVTIHQQPDKMTYKVGESFDPTGMVVYGEVWTDQFNSHYNTLGLQTLKSIEPKTFTKAGTITVTLGFSVKCKSGDFEILTTTLKVTVKEPDVHYPYFTGITIKQKPNKLTYDVGESIDLDGLKVVGDRVRSASETDQYNLTSNYYSVSPTSFTKAGQQTVTVKATLGGKNGNETFKATFKVTVNEKKTKPNITKSPTKETVDEGGSCKFVAKAENYDNITWQLCDSKGKNVMTVSQAASKYKPLTVSGASKETLKLSNIPASLNGWYVYAVFKNDVGQSTTEKAKLTVRKTEITPTPDNSTPVPEVTKEPVITPEVTATPTPTPEPTATPEPVHEHSFGMNWVSDEKGHRHVCDCGETSEDGPHSYTWTTVSKATKKADGEEVGKCSVCGYMTSRSIAYEAEKNGMSPVMILLIVVAVLLFGVLILLIVILLKRKKAEQRRAARIEREQDEE